MSDHALSGEQRTKCYKLIRILNIVSSIAIIGFGLAGLIFMAIINILSLKFFLVFSPIFMMFFGVLLLAAECRLKFILKYFRFLGTLIGRGIFNIYMSSIVFYYFSCDAGSQVAGWILAIILFVLGLVYLGMNFCEGGKQYARQMEEQAEQ